MNEWAYYKSVKATGFTCLCKHCIEESMSRRAVTRRSIKSVGLS